MTYLCVSIFVQNAEQTRRDIALAAEAGADMVELRIDQLTGADEVSRIVSNAMLPCIVTCRPTWEGGQSQLPDEQRLALLDQEVPYVDIEWVTAQRASSLPRRPRSRILSSHDFSGRPTRLHNLVMEMSQGPGDVIKLAWMARSIRDNIEAFELLSQRQRPMIALCMGEAGLISRILARKFGAFLTFAALSTDAATAPGQVTITDMKNLYRWDAIGPQTKVYGVVAQPVMHSMSPAIHNAAFSHVGYDGVYLPLLVEGSYESFKAFMETCLHFAPLHLSGLSVTLPHKENALRYLQSRQADVEPLAQAIGAVNTILIERGKAGPVLRGRNTDYAAILDSITAKLGITREQLSDFKVAVIGAGGTGRTAVAGLAHYGATVVVYNRTADRARALASEFDGRRGRVSAEPLEKLADSDCRIYINTTSVGMYPKVDESPAGDRPPKFSDRTLVFDTIYNPMQTKLLSQAQQFGAQVIGGVEMFVRQAAAQFELWTGRQAPRDVMRQVVEARLSGRA